MRIIIENSSTHVKEIPNTTLLMSLHHNYEESAKLEIFDISRKDQINKIYSFEEVRGGDFIYIITKSGTNISGCDRQKKDVKYSRYSKI